MRVVFAYLAAFALLATALLIASCAILGTSHRAVARGIPADITYVGWAIQVIAGVAAGMLGGLGFGKLAGVKAPRHAFYYCLLVVVISVADLIRFHVGAVVILTVALMVAVYVVCVLGTCVVLTSKNRF